MFLKKLLVFYERMEDLPKINIAHGYDRKWDLKEMSDEEMAHLAQNKRRSEERALDKISNLISSNVGDNRMVQQKKQYI